jgi:hypothetical protein
MANVKAQRPDKVTEAKEKAAAANSVPQLRIAVEVLAEANEAMQLRLDKLEKKVGR